MRILRQFLGNRLGAPFVIVERILRQPSQSIHSQIAGLEVTGQELRITPPVRKMRECKLSPGANTPMAIPVIDHFNRSAVRIRVILVKIRGAPQRRQDDRILAVLPVQGYACKREVVVTRGRAGVVVFSPVAIGRLLHGGEAADNRFSQALPFLVAEHPARKMQRRGPQRVMIGRCADEGRVIPGEIQPLGGIRRQRSHILFNLPLPARAALLSQLAFEKPVSFEPHVRVPVAVQPRCVASLFILTCQEVADPYRQREHPVVMKPVVVRMFLCVEHCRSQDRVWKVPPTGARFESLKIGAGLGVQPLLDLCAAGFHEAEVPGRQSFRAGQGGCGEKRDSS